MNFLVDYNLGRHIELLLGNLASQGWLELLPHPFPDKILEAMLCSQKQI